MFKRRRRDPRPPIEFVRPDPAVERRSRITLLRWRAREYRLCMTCGLVFDRVVPSDGGPRQLCRCVPSNADEWRGDLSERAHLCACCRLELLPSGSRWSVWFCPECLDRVRELNARLGRYAVPIGRHSLMAGVGVPGEAVINATDADLAAIAASLHHSLMGMMSSIDRLHAFARDRTAHLARRLGLESEPSIALDEWFARLGALTDTYPGLGKRGSFRALVRWFADPTTTG